MSMNDFVEWQVERGADLDAAYVMAAERARALGKPRVRLVLAAGTYPAALDVDFPAEIVAAESGVELTDRDARPIIVVRAADPPAEGASWQVRLAGVSLRATAAERCVLVEAGLMRLEDCHLSPAEDGIVVSGTSASIAVVRCTIEGAGGSGISCHLGDHVEVRDSTIAGCGERGIYVCARAALIAGCAVADTEDAGIEMNQGFGKRPSSLGWTELGPFVVERTSLRACAEGLEIGWRYGDAEVTDVQVTGPGEFGITLRPGTRARVQRCTIRDCELGVGVYGGGKHAAEAARLEDLSVSACDTGLRVSYNAAVSATRCVVLGGTNAIDLDIKASAELVECRMEGATCGVNVSQWSHARLTGCIVADTTESAVELRSRSLCSAAACTFERHPKGVLVWDSGLALAGTVIRGSRELAVGLWSDSRARFSDVQIDGAQGQHAVEVAESWLLCQGSRLDGRVLAAAARVAFQDSTVAGGIAVTGASDIAVAGGDAPGLEAPASAALVRDWLQQLRACLEDEAAWERHLADIAAKVQAQPLTGFFLDPTGASVMAVHGPLLRAFRIDAGASPAPAAVQVAELRLDREPLFAAASAWPEGFVLLCTDDTPSLGSPYYVAVRSWDTLEERERAGAPPAPLWPQSLAVADDGALALSSWREHLIARNPGHARWLASVQCTVGVSGTVFHPKPESGEHLLFAACTDQGGGMLCLYRMPAAGEALELVVELDREALAKEHGDLADAAAQACFSSDGERLAVFETYGVEPRSDRLGALIVFDVGARKRLWHHLIDADSNALFPTGEGQLSPRPSLGFGPDDRTVWIAAAGGDVLRFDAASGTPCSPLKVADCPGFADLLLDRRRGGLWAFAGGRLAFLPYD